jgi:hypothetical protein
MFLLFVENTSYVIRPASNDERGVAERQDERSGRCTPHSEIQLHIMWRRL